MDDTGNDYRLQKISEIQKQLEAEKEKRADLGRKYKKGIKAVNAIDYVLATSVMGLSVAGVGLLTTIIAAPAVITTETVTIGAGMLFVLNRQLNKKLVIKANKHEKLEGLAEEILNKISNHISVALNDSKISAEEFSLILSEANTFLETKEKLRSKSKENTDLESKVVKPLLQRMQTLKR